MNESPYALSLIARKPNIIEHSAWAVAATSHEDAEAKGMEEALRLWPTEQGWSTHHVNCIEVSMSYVSRYEKDNDPLWPEIIM